MSLKLVCDYLRLKTTPMKAKTANSTIALYTTFIHENKHTDNGLSLELGWHSCTTAIPEEASLLFAATQNNVLEQ